MVKGESLLKTLSKENLQPLKHRPLYSIQKNVTAVNSVFDKKHTSMRQCSIGG